MARPSVQVEEEGPETYPNVCDNIQDGSGVGYVMIFSRSDTVDFVQRLELPRREENQPKKCELRISITSRDRTVMSMKPNF